MASAANPKPQQVQEAPPSPPPQVGNGDQQWQLKSFEELPNWLQGNYFIRTSHRPPLPLITAFWSIFASAFGNTQYDHSSAPRHGVLDDRSLQLGLAH